MQEKHLVVGAGPVGRATARLLAARGESVVLASRSGRGPELPGVRRAAVDAADAAALGTLAAGAGWVYNAVNPGSYTTWTRDWPPVAAALLSAAGSSGAVLVTASSLYPYGEVDAPMREGQPDRAGDTKGALRARMWADALAAHEAGQVRAVEVRGSDYVGPGVGANGHVPRLVPAALAGRTVRVLGSPDQPHSWTDVRDMARALVAVGATPASHGRVWHAPTNPPRTQREAITDVCAAVGATPGRITAIPRTVLGLGGLVVPLLRELRTTLWQFERPYVLDSSAIERELGLAPTPWDEVCRATATGDETVLLP